MSTTALLESRHPPGLSSTWHLHQHPQTMSDDARKNPTAVPSSSAKSLDAFPSLDGDTLQHNPSEGSIGPPLPVSEKWQPARKSLSAAAFPPKRTHTRSQSSITETFGHIRTRTQSVSKNAHEIAEALKAPVSYKLIVCSIRLFRKHLFK